VSKSHSACKNHTLRVVITLVRVKITLKHVEISLKRAEKTLIRVEITLERGLAKIYFKIYTQTCHFQKSLHSLFGSDDGCSATEIYYRTKKTKLVKSILFYIYI
jgi:hypothetical protein